MAAAEAGVVRNNANVAVYRKAGANEKDQFVVTWMSSGKNLDPSGEGVFARVFSGEGKALAGGSSASTRPFSGTSGTPR